MKIQLAMQGGGAKLVTLLGAASAIQELQRQNRLTVTRVVGTSAGAIAGAMLAAGVNIDAFREQLRAGTGRKIVDSLANPGGGKRAWTVLTGDPIWKTDVLRSVLQGMLRERSQQLGNKPMTMLSDIQKATGAELRVVAADLRSPRPVVYRPDGNDKEIVTALLDSAGIPIYFRTWKHGSLVDGGLVQNFPWDELVGREKDNNGPIIGLSFAPSEREIASKPLAYAGALLNTAMESATERARTRLGADRVLTLPSEFDTFDFKAAFSEMGLGNHYELVKLQTREWFECLLKNSGLRIEADPWSSASVSVMEKLAKMYETQHRKSLLKYLTSTLEVAAHSLEREDEADVVTNSFTFNTTNREIYCHTVALSQANQDSGVFKKSEIVLLDSGKQPITVDFLPIADAKTPEKREILLFFGSVLPAHSGPYTLTVTDYVRGLWGDLLRAKRDGLYMMAQRTDTTVDRVEIVLHVPEGYGHASMEESTELGPRQTLGRKMEEQELGLFKRPAPGWRRLGWMGERVQPQEYFGPSIVL